MVKALAMSRITHNFTFPTFRLRKELTKLCGTTEMSFSRRMLLQKNVVFFNHGRHIKRQALWAAMLPMRIAWWKGTVSASRENISFTGPTRPVRTRKYSFVPNRLDQSRPENILIYRTDYTIQEKKPSQMYSMSPSFASDFKIWYAPPPIITYNPEYLFHSSLGKILILLLSFCSCHYQAKERLN